MSMLIEYEVPDLLCVEFDVLFLISIRCQKNVSSKLFLCLGMCNVVVVCCL